MNVKEKAQEWVDQYEDWPRHKDKINVDSACVRIKELLAAHDVDIKQAVAAEREACAMLAFSTSAYKAIRQREGR